MSVQDDIRLRLSIQRALLTNITPQLRAVSVDIEPERHKIWLRFIFDGEPSTSVREAIGCVGAEVIADYVDGGWEMTEEVMSLPAPARMEHRRICVYARCEDEWVNPRA